VAAEQRPLKITIIGIHYAPEPSGNAPYTAGLAAGLSRRGHRVKVITGYPHYPWWKVAEGYGGWSMTEVLDGVRVKRVRHYVPRNPSTLRRALMELGFGLRSVLTGWGRPDVVLLVTPALFASRVAMLRASLSRVPVVTWVQDIYTLGLVQTGGDARQAALVKRVESGLMSRSTRVVVIHDRFKAWLAAHLHLEVPLDVVRNWSHVASPGAFERDEVRALHGWSPTDVVVLHAGNMGVKQGLENVVATARLASDSGSRVKLVLLGDGNQRQQLEALDPSPRLQFIDPLPDGLFEQTMAAADILLVNELPGMTEMSVPSKLTSYYTTGLPVVAAVNSESTTASEVSLAGAGVVVEPGDPAALLRELEALAADPELAVSLGAAGNEFRFSHLSEAAALDGFEQALSLAAQPQSSER
jgi:colanic acid biosynthesis glycosyl transferase WcaI